MQILRFLLLASALAVASASSSHPKTRHDYKLTVKAPFLYTDNRTMPFYERYGAALPNEETIRLTSSMPHLKGSIWSKKQNPHKEWMVHLAVRISGHGRVGGDGLAFWYTKERGIDREAASGRHGSAEAAVMDPTGSHLGPVYGSADYWDGFGLILDTYDEQMGNRNRPYVFGVLNDGQYSLASYKNPMDKQIGGCYHDYRNQPGHLEVQIIFQDSSMDVSLDSQGHGHFEHCFTVKNVHLPTDYYFGVSSSTSELADDHDLLWMDVYEVNPHSSSHTKHHENVHISEEEKHKLDQFEEELEKADRLREESIFDHEEHDGSFHGDNAGGSSGGGHLDSTDMQRLLENQFKILDHLEGLARHLDGQSSSSSSSSHSSSKTTVVDLSHVEHTLENLHTEVNSLRQDVSSVVEVLRDVAQVISHQGTPQGERDREKLENLLNHLSTRVDAVHQSAHNLYAKTEEESTSMFTYIVLFAICQLVVMVAFHSWKNRQSEKDKKFI